MKNIYRKFKTTDIVALVELMAQLGYTHTEESLLGNILSVREAKGEIFVCEIAGCVRGCSSAILDCRLAEGVSGEIVSVVVNDFYRGQGIGRGLVAYAEGWLKERVSNISIRANTTREEAHIFYQNMGYTLSKTQAVFKKVV